MKTERIWIPHQVRNDTKVLFIVLSLSMMICLCGLIAPAHAQQCVAIQSSTPDVWLYGCESRLTTNPADQYDPAISGDLVVYTDARAGNADVWYYDIGAGQEVQVTNALGDQKLSDVSNGSVVYVDLPTSDVVLYSAVTGSTTNLTASANSVSLYPAIGDGTVAWVDDRTGEKEVFARSLATGEERRVTDSPLPDDLPAVSAGLIVWQRCEGGRCEIFSYNWATETTRQLTQTSGSDERHPDISGNGVVYDGERDGDVRDIFFYDLSSGTEKRLALAGYQENPNISGDYVAFEDYSSGPAHIKLWHVPSNSVFQVTTGPGQQYLNDIDGNRIVYTDSRNGQLDIYMLEFNVAPTANAGPDRVAQTGSPAILDGSASSDLNNDYPLAYAWRITSAPAGSTASLAGDTTATPSLTPDKPGSYTVELIVTDSRGLSSTPDTAMVTALNSAPVARAGSDQTVDAGATAQLAGAASSDPNGDPLTYQWTMGTKPAGSSASLSGATSSAPSFVADASGEYVITLVVTDPYGASSSDDVKVTALVTNTPPVAHNKSVAVTKGVPTAITLTASDADGNPLTFAVVSGPSHGTLTGIAPNLTYAPAAGFEGADSFAFQAYDGTAYSNVATVSITVSAPSGDFVTFLPIGNEVVPSGAIYGICWQAPLSAVKFDLQYTTNGTDWMPIMTLLGLNCVNWELPVVTANKKNCYAKVIAYDSNNVKIGEGISERFTIEVLRITSPNGGEVLRPGSTWNIGWKSFETIRPVAKTKLLYTTNRGTTYKLIKTFIGNPGATTASYSWRVPNVLSTKCKVKVILKDASGVNVGTDVSDKVFTIQP